MATGVKVLEKLHSYINGFFFWWRSQIKWRRSGYKEQPVIVLHYLKPWQQSKIRKFKNFLSLPFESRLNRLNSLQAYQVLDILKQLMDTSPPQDVVVDIGSRNFCYVFALHEFFKPQKLIGIELDAYKVCHDGFSRHDYAQHYVAQCGVSEYLATDFLKTNLQASVITYFFPFVLKFPLLKWTLPLSQFKPQELFNKICATLLKRGIFIMVNQGEAEFDVARLLAQNAGLSCQKFCVLKNTWLEYNDVLYLSLWGRNT